MAKTRTSSKVKDRYNAKAYDEIKVRVSKGRKDEIQAYVERHGQSVNGFINSLIDEAMERERVGAGAAGSPAVEDRPGVVIVSGKASPIESIYSRFTSQSGADFQAALSSSGQSAEDYIKQAVAERVNRETRPPIPQWIAERYPGERWPVLKAVRAIQGNINAQRILHRSMTQEQRMEWDKEFRRELDEERREGGGQDTPKPTCNLPLDD